MFAVQIHKKQMKEFSKSLDMKKYNQNSLVLLLREIVAEKYSDLLGFGNFRRILGFTR